MGKPIKLSVIIPVYNTAEYLAECFESILNQTLKELEILVVDDGSTDGSWDIIEGYNKKFDKIRAFRQERKRQGAARNLALQHARGEYVAFSDSDDTIPLTAYEKMYVLAKVNDSDMVAGIQQSFNNIRKWKSVPIHNEKFTKVIPICNVFQFPELLSDISACNRILKREKIAEKKIQFSEKTSGEDLDFMARVFLRFKRITILPEVVYNYRARSDASTGRISSSFFRDRVLVTEELGRYFQFHGGQDVFVYLLRSELRKLVKNRIVKVIHGSGEQERIEVFLHIQRLANRMTAEEISESDDFSNIAKIRLLLLWFGEFEALVLSEKKPSSFAFISLISSKECSILSAPHIKKIKLEQANPFNKRRLKNYKRTLRRAYYFSKKLIKRILVGRWTLVVSVFKYCGVLLYTKVYKKGTISDVWLIDEREAQSAEDNSYHLFKYLRKNHPELPVFYILNKKSQDWKNLEGLGNVVDLFSWRHMYLLKRSKVLLSTDSLKNLACPFEVLPILQHKTHNVFLQHGIVALKDVSYTKAKYPSFSQVITSNERERNLFIERYGYSSEEVTITGLARYDALHENIQKSRTNNSILILPTWRKWIRGRRQFYGSTFFTNWSELLKDSLFGKLLEKYNTKVYFYPHFKLGKFLHEFQPNSSNISLVNPENTPLQELIIDCDILITDYSSVIWDFLYQKKPTLCYMFDREDMAKRHNGPPPLDFDKDIPAPICYSATELNKNLEVYLENGYKILPEHQTMVSSFYKYRDNSNCKRIYESAFSMAQKI